MGTGIGYQAPVAGHGVPFLDPEEGPLSRVPPPLQSLDSCVELESLRERVHRLQVGSEAREELRLPAQREEGKAACHPPWRRGGGGPCPGRPGASW